MIVFNEDQLRCIDAYVKGDNAIVEAVAGSGKTTTILGMFSRCPEKRTVVLTYNKPLCVDTKKKYVATLQKAKSVTDKHGNILQIYTFHGFVTKCYEVRDGEFGDPHLRAVLAEDRPLRWRPPGYASHQEDWLQSLLLDEVQDMTPLLYRMVMKLIADWAPRGGCQISVFGDRFQNIYTYKKADARYLLEAEKLFAQVSSRSWARLSLSKTHRLNMHHSAFHNRFVLDRPHFVSTKSGPKPIVVRGDPYRAIQHLHNIRKFNWDDYTPDDIMVLNYSLDPNDPSKYAKPIHCLANRLTRKGWGVYFADKEGTCDQEKMKGKVIFNTFHRSKGMERPLVIVFGVDASYYRFYDKEATEEQMKECPNIIHVALTRASEQLIVIQGDEPLPNMNYEIPDLEHFVDIVDLPRSSRRYKEQEEKTRGLSVSELLAFQPAGDLEEVLSHVEVIDCFHSLSPICLPNDVPGRKGLSEEVAQLNGIILNMKNELLHTKELKSAAHLLAKDESNQSSRSAQHRADRLASVRRRIVEEKEQVRLSDLAYLATYGLYMEDKLEFRFAQLPYAYDWLEPFNDVICEALSALPALSHFESNLEVPLSDSVLIGRCDAVDIGTREIIELKVTSSITREHQVQAALYHYMSVHAFEGGVHEGVFSKERMKGTRLINLKLGKTQLLTVKDMGSFRTAIERLLWNKRKRVTIQGTPDFLTAQLRSAMKWIKRVSNGSGDPLQEVTKHLQALSLKSVSPQETTIHAGSPMIPVAG